MARIRVDQLLEVVQGTLKAHRESVLTEIKSDVKDAAIVCVKHIQANSPKKTGGYQKGWKVKKVFDGATSARYRIYNKTAWQLTHLLEFGHALRQGGRYEGKPHIIPAMKKAERELEARIRETLEGAR